MISEIYQLRAGFRYDNAFEFSKSGVLWYRDVLIR